MLAPSHGEVLEGMPIEEVAPSVDLFHFESSDPTTPVLKTLGMVWITETDCLAYSQDLLKEPIEWSRRTVLSTVARLFDPLGLLAPFVVTAQIILQQCIR